MVRTLQIVKDWKKLITHSGRAVNDTTSSWNGLQLILNSLTWVALDFLLASQGGFCAISSISVRFGLLGSYSAISKEGTPWTIWYRLKRSRFIIFPYCCQLYICNLGEEPFFPHCIGMTLHVEQLCIHLSVSVFIQILLLFHWAIYQSLFNITLSYLLHLFNKSRYLKV